MEFNLESLLDSVSKLYSLDVEKFLEIWPQRPVHIIKHMSLSEDEIEYLLEVNSWYLLERAKRRKHRQLTRPSFTLRNPEDLEEFEEFLDKMLKLLSLSPGHFIQIFPKCPTIYWDKVDDLRETSFKLKRDSDEYLRCLEKCKELSFAYSNFLGILEDNFCETKDDYYDEEDYY